MRLYGTAGRSVPTGKAQCTLTFQLAHGAVLGLSAPAGQEKAGCPDGSMAVRFKGAAAAASKGGAGVLACVPCAAGYVSTGGGQCIACVKPGYSGARGGSTCQTCPANTYPNQNVAGISCLPVMR